MTKDYCLFCDRDNKEKHHIVAENDLFFARFDNFPVSAGHIQIIPKRHVISFFDLSEAEIISMYDLVKITKEIVEKEFKPDGYNIGLNEGRAAGRSIDHFHFHIIPRYTGDVANPRGGIRHIIEGEGNY